jgi:hypothetical protein
MRSFPDAGFTQTDGEEFDTLNFNMSDPRGTFAKMQHELTGLANKFYSGGCVDFHGYTFSHDQELVHWFHYHKGKNSIFADAVAILHSVGATVVHTQESTHTQEAAKKICLDSDIEASIQA